MPDNTATDAVVEIGGDVSGLKKALDDARGALQGFEAGVQGTFDTVKTAFGNFDGVLGAVKTRMDLASYALGAAGLAGAVMAAKGVFNELKSISSEWAEVGADAKARGINAEFLQELRIQAGQFNVEQSSVNAGMKTFLDNLGEVRKDGTVASDAVKSFDDELLKSLKATKDQKEALRLVADALATHADETERAKLAATLFGKEHADLANILVGGAKGLDAWAERARASGQVVDNETVESAKRLKNALDAIANSPGFRALEGLAVVIATDVAKSLGSLQVLTDAELNTRLADTAGKIALYRVELERLKSTGVPDSTFSKAWQEAKDVLNWDWSSDRSDALRLGPDGLAARIKEMETQQTAIEALRASRSGWGARQEAIAAFEPETPPEAPKDATAAVKWAAALNIRMLEASGDFYAAIEAQRAADLAEFDKYVEKFGDDWEGAAKARLDIERKYATAMRDQWAKDIQPVSNVISGDLERAFDGWIDKGKLSWRDLANSMLSDMAKMALKMAVFQPLFGGGQTTGGGLFASMTEGLSSLFKNAGGNAFTGGEVIPFADGGVVTRPSIFGMRDGQTGLMGEAGPEAIMPLARGSDGKLGVQMTGAGGGTVVHFSVNATDASSFQRSEGQITAMLSRAVARGNRNR